MAGPSNWRRAWYNHGLNKQKGIDDMERTCHLVGLFSYFCLSPDPRADPTPCIQADDVYQNFRASQGAEKLRGVQGTQLVCGQMGLGPRLLTLSRVLQSANTAGLAATPGWALLSQCPNPFQGTSLDMREGSE